MIHFPPSLHSTKQSTSTHWNKQEIAHPGHFGKQRTVGIHPAHPHSPVSGVPTKAGCGPRVPRAASLPGVEIKQVYGFGFQFPTPLIFQHNSCKNKQTRHSTFMTTGVKSQSSLTICCIFTSPFFEFFKTYTVMSNSKTRSRKLTISWSFL